MNKQIVTAAFVITASGVVNAMVNGKPLSKVIMGGYIFLLMLSIIDMFGGNLAKFAGALSMLAVVYVLLTVFPWTTVLQAIGIKGK